MFSEDPEQYYIVVGVHVISVAILFGYHVFVVAILFGATFLWSPF